jgi:rod shape-determining protein MreD
MIAERLGLVGRGALVVIGVLLLQVAVVADLRTIDAVGDLVLLIAIAAGSVGGADRGATAGFVAGLSYDLLLDSPFGLQALTCVVAGYATGWMLASVRETQWWFHVGSTLGISAGAVLFSAVVARITGLAFALDDVVRSMLVVALWSGALILPARRLWRWVYGVELGDRYGVLLP